MYTNTRASALLHTSNFVPRYARGGTAVQWWGCSYCSCCFIILIYKRNSRVVLHDRMLSVSICVYVYAARKVVCYVVLMMISILSIHNCAISSHEKSYRRWFLNSSRYILAPSDRIAYPYHFVVSQNGQNDSYLYLMLPPPGSYAESWKRGSRSV
jgi:hypothetical protein